METETLALLEAVAAQDADARTLFASERGDVRVGARRRHSIDDVARFAEFLADVVEGRRPEYLLREVMTTDDFPTLFGDVIDRTLLGGYREWPSPIEGWVRQARVRDFRTVKRYAVDGAEGVLSAVDEKSVYPEGALSSASYSYAVQKYGRKLAFSWEAQINDDLGAFITSVGRMGRAARRSEAKFVTTLYVDASGPHASFYTVGNKNIINTTNGAATNNPALSLTGLTDAMKVIARQVDADGEPIALTMLHLVVPPSLEIVAQNILNAITIEMADLGGTANQKLIAQNWIGGRIRLHVDPYIPVVASSANGATSWFLFADEGESRPALEIGRLVGHEEPETFVKAPDAIKVGGGEDPLNGDFDTDQITYKVRHVFGGSRIDPKMTVASNGSGA